MPKEYRPIIATLGDEWNFYIYDMGNPSAQKPSCPYPGNIDYSHSKSSDMATDKNGKLTFEMKSPGEAWNDHVNNDLNAKSVTPSYLEPKTEKGPGVDRINKHIEKLEKEQDAVAIGRNREKSLEQEYKKESKMQEKAKDKEIGHSR